MKIRPVVMKVTPERAAKWLKLNTRNRNLRGRHVETLSTEMLKGNWKVNGDAIRLNDVMLIDGQHRLEAIVRSGVTIESVVCFDVASDTFDTIDKGMKRTAADTLHLRGEKNTNVLAGAARLASLVEAQVPNLTVRFTDQEIVAIIDRHPLLREFAGASGGKATKKLKLLTCSQYAALRTLFAEKDYVLADAFFTHLNDGDLYAKDAPVSLLRERLLENTASVRKMTPFSTIAMIIKAWNAMRTGKKIALLRVANNENMPGVM